MDETSLAYSLHMWIFISPRLMRATCSSKKKNVVRQRGGKHAKCKSISTLLFSISVLLLNLCAPCARFYSQINYFRTNFELVNAYVGFWGVASWSKCLEIWRHLFFCSYNQHRTACAKERLYRENQFSNFRRWNKFNKQSRVMITIMIMCFGMIKNTEARACTQNVL